MWLDFGLLAVRWSHLHVQPDNLLLDLSDFLPIPQTLSLNCDKKTNNVPSLELNSSFYAEAFIEIEVLFVIKFDF